MGSNLQKIGLAVIVVLLLAYGGYYAYRTGRSTSNLLGLRQVSGPAATTVSPSPSAGNGGVASTKMSSEEKSLLNAINTDRRAAKLPALAVSDTLMGLARAHAADMAARGYFDHTTPDGLTFNQRLSAAGYTGDTAGENIGLTSSPVLTVITDWMDSPQHRDNILGAGYSFVGLGVARGQYKGQTVSFVVAIFGSSR